MAHFFASVFVLIGSLIEYHLQFPKVKNIYLVIGNSEYEKRMVSYFKNFESKYDGKLVFRYMNDATYDVMIKKIGTLGNDSVVYFVQWPVDSAGNQFIPAEVIKEICKTTSVPVIGGGSQFLGTGTIGGYVYDFQVIGTHIGNTISELIDGKTSNTNVIKVASSHYVFDYSQLKRYGLDKADLPVESNIINEPVNFFELYKVQIVLGIIVLMIQLIFISILLRNIRKWRVAENKLIDLNKTLEEEIYKRTCDLETANEKLSEINKTLYDRSEEMEVLATTDRLTKVYNRMKTDQILANEFLRFKRNKNVFSGIIADIDFFKKINDTFGHQAGDIVLMQCAELFKKNIRRVDSVGRWGGEEFLFICPDTDSQGALIIAESLRRKVEENLFDDKHQITSSFGVAQVRVIDQSEQDVFKRADEALYVAKNNGRNCVAYDGKWAFDYIVK